MSRIIERLAIITVMPGQRKPGNILGKCEGVVTEVENDCLMVQVKPGKESCTACQFRKQCSESLDKENE